MSLPIACPREAEEALATQVLVKLVKRAPVNRRLHLLNRSSGDIQPSRAPSSFVLVKQEKQGKRVPANRRLDLVHPSSRDIQRANKEETVPLQHLARRLGVSTCYAAAHKHACRACVVRNAPTHIGIRIARPCPSPRRVRLLPSCSPTRLQSLRCEKYTHM
jgi:hypothetical protein